MIVAPVKETARQICRALLSLLYFTSTVYLKNIWVG